MTACKDSLNGKKAVSATLAGVLAVGTVPAAAFAATDAQAADTQDEQGIELQSVESAKAFSDGTVAGTLYQNGSSSTNPSYNAKQPVTFKASTVTLKTSGTVDVSDTDVYEVTYYAQDKDGKPTGDAISAPVEAGKYCAVVTAKSGTYEGGAAVYKFTIAANEFSNLTNVALDEDGKPTGDATFTYTGFRAACRLQERQQHSQGGQGLHRQVLQGGRRPHRRLRHLRQAGRCGRLLRRDYRHRQLCGLRGQEAARTC